MKRWQKRVATTGLVAGAVMVTGISATVGWRPFVGPRARALTHRTFERTPARVERGEYLVRNVAGCLYCHSELDGSSDGLPLAAGREGAGKVWTAEELPWIAAPNLTPDPDTGAGRWPDDAIARAVREGVGHDGRALFPIMPYKLYRAMSDEDLASVIAYIRSLRPIRNALPRTTPPFPVNRLINNEPQPLEGSVAPPDLSTPARRGEYLVRLAACTDCHTPMDDRGQFVRGMEFAGGNPFPYEGRRTVSSANITPATNGIPYYTEELFLETIRTGRVRERKLADQMPWLHYRNMTDEDLTAIFAYLRTLAPVEHYVDNSMDPTPCARCGRKHGGGMRNKGA